MRRLIRHCVLVFRLAVLSLSTAASGKLYLSSLTGREVQGLIDSVGLTQFSAETITSMDQLESELERIRERGYAIDNQEFLAGTVAIGVPVYDFKKRLSLVLTVQAPVFRLPIESVERCLPALMRAAKRLETLMRPDVPS